MHFHIQFRSIGFNFPCLLLSQQIKPNSYQKKKKKVSEKMLNPKQTNKQTKQESENSNPAKLNY